MELFGKLALLVEDVKQHIPISVIGSFICVDGSTRNLTILRFIGQGAYTGRIAELVLVDGKTWPSLLNEYGSDMPPE